MSWEKYTTAGNTNRYQGFFKDADVKDFMIDVGSHIGKTGLPVAALGHPVIGFEPDPNNMKILTGYIKTCGFKDIYTVIPLALSSISGKAKLYIPKGRGDNSSLIREAALERAQALECQSVDSLDIKTTTIDTWFKNNKNYLIKNAKLLKIDAHGSEYAVLKGASAFLGKAKSYKKLVIEIEYHPNILDAAKIKGQKILELLNSLGYSIHVPILGLNNKIMGYELLKKSEFKKFKPSTGIDIIARCD